MVQKGLLIVLIFPALHVAISTYFFEVLKDGTTTVLGYDVLPLTYFHKCSYDKHCTHIELDLTTGKIQLIIQPEFRQRLPKGNIRLWLKLAAGPSSIQYRSLGCYTNKDYYPLNHFISTERSRPSFNYNGHYIDWDNFELVLPGMVYRCLLSAASFGYSTAALMSYGECWSGENATDYDLMGISVNCVSGNLVDRCPDGGKLCVGGDDAIYVYQMIKSND